MHSPWFSHRWCAWLIGLNWSTVDVLDYHENAMPMVQFKSGEIRTPSIDGLCCASPAVTTAVGLVSGKIERKGSLGASFYPSPLLKGQHSQPGEYSCVAGPWTPSWAFIVGLLPFMEGGKNLQARNLMFRQGIIFNKICLTVLFHG